MIKKTEVSLEDFINDNMSDESKLVIEEESGVLLKEFDAVLAISSRINTIDDLEEFIIECITDGDIISKTDMKVVLKCIDKLKGEK